MNLRVFTDGGSKGNPGLSSIGLVIYQDEVEVVRYREDIGIGTNNEAEYRALIKALELLKEYLVKQGAEKEQRVEKVLCFSDSRLMVNQVNGLFKIKEARMRDFVMKIRILEAEIGMPIVYQYIPREQNTLADALVNNKS